MKKQILLLILTLLPMVASADATGKCGKDLTWVYDSESETLTISGAGEMKDYEYYSFSYAPWYDYKANIKTVIINSGVTSIGNYAFYNCAGITSITIPNSVTSIGKYAFQNCSGLISITIPNSVTSIGDCVFKGCGSLTSITIPNSVAAFGSGVFQGCNSLTSPVYNVTFFAYMPRSYKGEYIMPDGIEVICDLAFSDCKDLTTISIPNSVTSIEGDAFSDCDGLASITIPDKVKTIKSHAFYGCSGLTSVTIGNGLTNIGEYAFYGCSKLSSITIPNNVKTIGNYAFAYCLGLTSVIIGNNVTSIGEYAFRHCYLLPSITIPNSVTNIGYGAFKECNALTSPIHNNTLFAYMPPSFEGEYIIPGGINEILDEAFKDCSSMTSITIPNSVTNIGTSAFSGCNKLIDVTVGIEQPLSISENTFTNKDARLRVPYRTKSAYSAADYWKDFRLIVEIIPPSQNITFADANVKAICVGNWDLNDDGELSEAEAGTVTDLGIAFRNNTMITSFDELRYFTWITSIGEFAFRDCSNLSSIIIPNNVKSIVGFAFDGCSSLTSITIPNSVSTIGGGAFCNSGLKDVDIPNSVTTIGSSAFYGCNGLSNIVIPNSVTFIDESAFGSCTGLKSVIIGNGTTSIGEYVFSACTNLSSITVDEGNNTYDSRNNCNAIVETATNTLVAGCKNTIISNSVTSIGKCAFQGYSSLTSIDIPNSVTSIGYFAFSGCGLTSITIPSSVTAIGWGALDISSLTSLTIMCTTPPDIDVYNPPIFTNRDKITLYVPANCKSIYEEESINGDYWWKGFKEIIEIGENPDIDPSDSKNTLKGNDLQVSCGTNVTLPIELNNELEVRHCQFDLQLPAGITVATKSNGKLDAKLTERAETHSISSQQLSNGNYRFIISSLDNDSFTGNSGTLVEITLDIPATMEAGEYTIKLLNAELSVPDGNDLKVVKPADTESKLTVKAYTPGDVNIDGSVSVTDVGCAINYILEQVPSVFVFEAADMNGDKSVSVTDVGMIINLILNEGAAASPQMNRAAAENAQLSMLSTTEGYQLQLGNKDVFIGFQMDVQVANSAAINDMKLMGGDDHLMTYRQLSNGMYRVVCYSPMNNTFVANDDALLNIAVNGNVTISNVRLTTAGLSEVYIDGISAGTTGITDVKGLQSDELKVYSLDGRLCRTISKQSGENPLSGLKAGVYMIGNRKVVVR